MFEICPLIIAGCKFEGCLFYSEKTDKCVFKLIMEALENKDKPPEKKGK